MAENRKRKKKKEKENPMEIKQWIIDAIQNNQNVIATLNPTDFKNKKIVSHIQNQIIDKVGNASQVYIYLEFRESKSVKPNEIIFSQPDKTELQYVRNPENSP